MIPQTSKISKRILGSFLIFSAQGGVRKRKKSPLKKSPSEARDKAPSEENSVVNKFWWDILNFGRTYFERN